MCPLCWILHEGSCPFLVYFNFTFLLRFTCLLFLFTFPDCLIFYLKSIFIGSKSSFAFRYFNIIGFADSYSDYNIINFYSRVSIACLILKLNMNLNFRSIENGKIDWIWKSIISHDKVWEYLKWSLRQNRRVKLHWIPVKEAS